MKQKKGQGRLLDGRYRLGAPAGRGGMSTVYRAQDIKTGQTVAVKLFKKELLENRELTARFKSEAQILSGLQLPSVIRLRGASLREPQLYLVLDFLSGATLDELFRNGYTLPLPWRQAVQLSLWLLDTLQALHEKGVAHRDVKPQNIMVTEQGEFFLIDFGNAGLLTGRAEPSAHAVGSVLYMSPDQAQGAPPDPRQDVYAAGVLLYQLLSGRLPYDGRDAVEIAQNHLTQTPPPLGGPQSELPPGLRDIVRRAMEKRPEARYPSAAAMAGELRILQTDPAARFAPPEPPPSQPNGSLRGFLQRLRARFAHPDAEEDDEPTPL